MCRTISLLTFTDIYLGQEQTESRRGTKQIDRVGEGSNGRLNVLLLGICTGISLLKQVKLAGIFVWHPDGTLDGHVHPVPVARLGGVVDDVSQREVVVAVLLGEERAVEQSHEDSLYSENGHLD